MSGYPNSTKNFDEARAMAAFRRYQHAESMHGWRFETLPNMGYMGWETDPAIPKDKRLAIFIPEAEGHKGQYARNPYVQLAPFKRDTP